MRFQPKTEDELKTENLWKAGEYGFEVVQEVTLGTNTMTTRDAISKVKEDGSGGNEMIQLVLKVFNDEGHSIYLMDYLLESAGKKLRNAAIACGLLSKYETGELCADDFVGKTGNIKLKIQSGKEKKDEPGEKYPDRNAVAGYLAGFNGMKAQAPANTTSDEIPF